MRLWWSSSATGIQSTRGDQTPSTEAIRFLGASASPARAFDDAHPMMTLALGDRFRLHAIGFGLSFRPSVTIRQHTLTDVTLRDLAEGGMMPLEVARFLHAAVLARKSIVISGDQGAGKTTLLRALIAAIPDTERFGTLETDYGCSPTCNPTAATCSPFNPGWGWARSRTGAVSGSSPWPTSSPRHCARTFPG